MPFRKSGRAILRYQCCCELAEIHYTHSVGALPYPLLFVHKMKIKKYSYNSRVHALTQSNMKMLLVFILANYECNV